MKIARFDKRMLAWFIDESIPCSIALVFFILGSIFKFGSDSWFLKGVISALIAFFLYVLYTSLLLALTNGFTIGAAILGIRIIRKDGNNLTYKECFLKSLCEGVIPFDIVNAFYMLFVRTERSVFDRLSDTLVTEYRHAND